MKKAAGKPRANTRAKKSEAQHSIASGKKDQELETVRQKLENQSKAIEKILKQLTKKNPLDPI